MSSNNQNGNNVTPRLRYLGMEWRFLKFYLQHDSLPPITSKAIDQIPEDRYDLDTKLCLENTENDKEAMRLEPESVKSSGDNVKDFSIDSCASFTREDLICGLKNVKLFKDQQLQTKNSPVRIRKNVNNHKLTTVSFNPRPPGRPKEIIAQSSYIGEWTKDFRKKRIKNSKQETLAQQLYSLDISKHFKM
jgi:hypothetical protein